MKHLQISSTSDVLLSLILLELKNEDVKKLVDNLINGTMKVEVQKVYRATEVFYKGNKFKLIERIFLKETPPYFSVIVNDNVNPVWRYDERPEEKGVYRMLQNEANLDFALFCSITPDFFLEKTMFAIGDNKFIHLKYKNLMMLAEEESLKETDKTISFNTKRLKMSTEGQIQVDKSEKDHDLKLSGLIYAP